MKLCRFDEDRLGVVIGDGVHDVTEAQSQIRAAARYDMKGDAVIAALPAWRKRIEDMAAKAPAIPLAQVKLISPVARPSKAMAAPTNYGKHIEEMAADVPGPVQVAVKVALASAGREPHFASLRRRISLGTPGSTLPANALIHARVTGRYR